MGLIQTSFPSFVRYPPFPRYQATPVQSVQDRSQTETGNCPRLTEQEVALLGNDRGGGQIPARSWGQVGRRHHHRVSEDDLLLLDAWQYREALILDDLRHQCELVYEVESGHSSDCPDSSPANDGHFANECSRKRDNQLNVTSKEVESSPHGLSN